MKMALFSVMVIPKTHGPNLIIRKNSDKFPLRSVLQNILPQNRQGHQKQEKSQKLSQPRGVSGDVMLKCNVVCRMGSWKKDNWAPIKIKKT